jgi:hypothetical protein
MPLLKGIGFKDRNLWGISPGREDKNLFLTVVAKAAA